jgi:hypothetical protein
MNETKIKIAVLTTVYNECLILPYFLRHYEYVDEIHVLYETDSKDDTLKILHGTPNVMVKNIHIKGGLDDVEKVCLINDRLRTIKADWVYVLDADELIFPPYGSPRDFLSGQDFDVVRAAMFQVFRNRADRDLDLSLPPVPQRIHGDPDIFSTTTGPNRDSNANYIKPIIVRPSNIVQFSPGNHNIEGNSKISPDYFIGVHWRMADPSIALVRRMKNKARMSEKNKENNMGWQHWNVTEKWIGEECDRHLDDPIIEALSPIANKSPLEVAKLKGRLFSREARIFELWNQIRDEENRIRILENQIKDIESRMRVRENQLMRIRGSITWRFASRLHRIIDFIFHLKK